MGHKDKTEKTQTTHKSNFLQTKRSRPNIPQITKTEIVRSLSLTSSLNI